MEENTSGKVENGTAITSPEQLREACEVEGTGNECFGHAEENRSVYGRFNVGPQREISYYCCDHSTDCCIACVPTIHRNCYVVTTKDIHFTFSRFMKRMKRIQSDVAREQEDDVMRVSYQSEIIRSHLQIGQQRIRNFYQEVRRKINEAERASLRKLEDGVEDKLTTVSSHFQEFESLKERIEIIVNEGEQLLNGVPARPQCSTKTCDRSAESKVRGSSLLRGSNDKEKGTADMVEFTRDQEDTIGFIEEKMMELNEMCERANVDVKNDDLFNLYSNLVDTISFAAEPTCSSTDQNANSTHNLPYSGKSKQEMHPSSIPGVHEKQPTTHFARKTYFSCEGAIKGMEFLPNTADLLVVTESPNQILHLSTNGEILRSVDLRDSPHGVCTFGCEVAVIFGNLNRINVYHLSDLGVTSGIVISRRISSTYRNMIGIADHCTGVCRMEETFFISSMKAVLKVNEKGNILCEMAYPEEIIALKASACGKYILIIDKCTVIALSRDLKSKLFSIESQDCRNLSDLYATDGNLFMSSYNSIFVYSEPEEGTFLCKINCCYPKYLCCSFDRVLVVGSENNYKDGIHRSSTSTIQILQGEHRARVQHS